MYNIGICDDGENVCTSIENMLLQYAQEKNIQVDTYIWYTGESLRNYLASGGYLDLLFLDIELFKMTGIEVGTYIRNQWIIWDCRLYIFREKHPMHSNYSKHSLWIF